MLPTPQGSARLILLLNNNAETIILLFRIYISVHGSSFFYLRFPEAGNLFSSRNCFLHHPCRAGKRMNDGSNIVGIVLGEKGTGKTPFLSGDEKAGITGLAEGYLKRDMKMLILDTYDHPKYRHIPVIQPKQIHYWKKGLYRFFASDLEEMFVQIKKNLYNCAVGLEDCHKYLDQYLLENYLNEINIDSKNRNNDILYISHAWALLRLRSGRNVRADKEEPL